jgi:hypothetical protein
MIGVGTGKTESAKSAASWLRSFATFFLHYVEIAGENSFSRVISCFEFAS